jgi:hypothetical protein
MIKKYFLKSLGGMCTALLMMSFMVVPAAAASASFYGMTVDLPEGWYVKQGEQVVIYSDSEKNAAVIVDQVAEGSANSVAEDLAGAVGVDKKNIRKDDSGALELNFTHNGEPIDARVLQKDQGVLMIYSIGGCQQAHQIARSLARGKQRP